MTLETTIETSLDAAAIAERLEAEARRGNLAGWHRSASPSSPGEIGRLSDFGTPFESELIVRVVHSATTNSEADAIDRPPNGRSHSISFDQRIKPRVPLLVLFALVATVWPGVILTDSLLRTYWTSYDWQTWMWYLPTTAPFVPLAMRSAWKRSTASGLQASQELIARVAKIVGGITRSKPPAAS